MLTSAGAVELPVRCTPKVCDVEVQPASLAVTPRAPVVLGEAAPAAFSILSKGALPLTYIITLADVKVPSGYLPETGKRRESKPYEEAAVVSQEADEKQTIEVGPDEVDPLGTSPENDVGTPPQDAATREAELVGTG